MVEPETQRGRDSPKLDATRRETKRNEEKRRETKRHIKNMTDMKEDRKAAERQWKGGKPTDCESTACHNFGLVLGRKETSLLQPAIAKRVLKCINMYCINSACMY
jgi:hypothetical protein